MFKKWLSKLAGNIVRKPQPACGVVHSVIQKAARPLGEPVHSDPPGLFSMYIDDEAMALVESEGHVKREEIATLPALVYGIAEASGLVRKDPMHIVLTTETGRKPTESAMTVTTIIPPIKANNGSDVSHAIVIFRDPFCYDMEQVENEYSASHARALDEQERQNFIQTRRTRCVTAISHELVHVFVTDEFMPRFKGWDLGRLEMLTDALTVAAMHFIIERSEDDFVRLGLMYGAAYLADELRSTRGVGFRPQDAVRAMETHANKIIQAECSVLIGPDERPGVRVERAEVPRDDAALTALVGCSGKLPGLP